MFTTPNGKPLDDSKVRKEFKGLLRKAELPQMRLHDLRHTCATLLIAQGVHARIVMETLGHSQISITMDLYSHVTAPMQAEAAAQMNAESDERSLVVIEVIPQVRPGIRRETATFAEEKW